MIEQLEQAEEELQPGMVRLRVPRMQSNSWGNSWPTVGSYTTDDNASTTCVCLPKSEPLYIFYSFATPIAFYDKRRGLNISENIWGYATGRHINALSRNKKLRLKRADFERALREAMMDYMTPEMST